MKDKADLLGGLVVPTMNDQRRMIKTNQNRPRIVCLA